MLTSAYPTGNGLPGGRHYTEREVNEIIQPIYADYVTIRRYLISYGLMNRTRNGSEYWLTE